MRVKLWECWVQKSYRPQTAQSYYEFMGGVDVCNQMTTLNKSKNEKRLYMYCMWSSR